MLGVVLVDAGLLTIFAGLLSVLRPLRFLGIRTRPAACAVSALGLALVVVGMTLPAPLRRVAVRATLLDDFMPAYQFHELHSLRVHAPPERVYAAIKQVTARDIRFFRLLTWIRSPRLPRGRTHESILAPSADDPILDVAQRGGFLLLAEEPPREIVLGTVVVGRVRPGRHVPADFVALTRPGFAKAAINFRVEDQGRGWSLVTTETRIIATSPGARRRFAAYWRVIYPGSSLIRREWLQAIRRRAEA